MGKHQGAGLAFFSYLCEKGLEVFEMGELNFLGHPAVWGAGRHPGVGLLDLCAHPALQKCLENVLS